MKRRALVLGAASLSLITCPLHAQTNPSTERPRPRRQTEPAVTPPALGEQLDPSTFAKPPGLAADLAPDVWPKAAFEAVTVEGVMGALGISNPAPGTAVLLAAPDIALATQPIRLRVETELPKVTRIVLVADRLAFPLVALLIPPAGRAVRVSVEAHLPRPTRVRAFVRSEATWYGVQREVRLALERA
jgi:sulfur-oxidizing protein SoxY